MPAAYVLSGYAVALGRWVKYGLIRCKSAMLGRTVVDFCGGTYLVAGNVVQRLGSCKRGD